MRPAIIYLLIAILLISGCARPYHKINMSSIPFKEFREETKISYSVRQGVLYNMKDFFYAKREMKKDLSLIAFKIVNKTEFPLRISDLQFSCGASVTITPVNIDDFFAAIKQKPELFWLYSTGVMPFQKGPLKPWIYLPFGAVMAGANFGIAYHANNKIYTDLKLLDLTNKVIQPYDSIQGLLPFKNVANCGDIFISIKE